MVALGILGLCSRLDSTTSIHGGVPPATFVLPCTADAPFTDLRMEERHTEVPIADLRMESIKIRNIDSGFRRTNKPEVP